MFVETWPTVEDLAAASTEAVIGAFAGLGYYSRARNLHACAKEIARTRRRFPDEEADLRALPGVGDYTAAAIAAIAFGRQAAPVDGNIARILARLLALDLPITQAKARIRAAATRPCAEPARRRLRPGADGYWRDDLSAAKSPLRRLSVERGLRGPPLRKPRSFPAAARRQTEASARRNGLFCSPDRRRLSSRVAVRRADCSPRLSNCRGPPGRKRGPGEDWRSDAPVPAQWRRTTRRRRADFYAL